MPTKIKEERWISRRTLPARSRLAGRGRHYFRTQIIQLCQRSRLWPEVHMVRPWPFAVLQQDLRVGTTFPGSAGTAAVGTDDRGPRGMGCSGCCA